jgi:hypothetical protein
MRPNAERSHAHTMPKPCYSSCKSDSIIHVLTPPSTRHIGSRDCQTIRQSLTSDFIKLTSVIQHSDLCSSLFVNRSMHSIPTLVVPEHVHLGSAVSHSRVRPLTSEEEMSYSLDGVADYHRSGRSIVSRSLVRVHNCGLAESL